MVTNLHSLDAGEFESRSPAGKPIYFSNEYEYVKFS